MVPQHQITVTGGFTPERIRAFEAMNVPADVYGVGSEHGTNTDFTADIVQVKVEGTWYPLSKIGRRSCDNPDLKPVTALPLC